MGANETRPKQIFPQGEGSGLDADKLDGKHAQWFIEQIELLKKRITDLEARR